MAELALKPARQIQWLRIPGAAYMLVILCVVFAIGGHGFTNVANIENVLTQSTILLLLALPATLIIMTEGVDLSAGAVLTFATVILAMTAVKTGSVVWSLGAALAVGALFGLANGWMIASLGIPPFVVTLGTLGVAQGLAVVVTDAQSVTGVGDNIVWFYSGAIAGIPAPILLAAVVYAVFHLLLYHTRFGTYVFALGGNPDSLRLAGVNANRYLILVYALGGAMAGLAALLLTARMSAGHPTAALGMEFDAIAAVAVGGTSFEKGNGWLFGTVLGVLVVGVLRNGLNLLGVQSSLQVVAIGVLVIAALLIDGFKGDLARRAA
jgi:ribose transport system permease protein